MWFVTLVVGYVVGSYFPWQRAWAWVKEQFSGDTPTE